MKPKKLNQKVHRQLLLREAQHFRDHKKGLPEWIKNSDDSYTRHEDSEEKDLNDAPILISFSKKEILCLDFGGTDHKKMIEHLPYWGSPDAATQGEKLKNKMVNGGHGNGGKYYALSQFKECKIVNYHHKKLTILTIKEDGEYIDAQEEEKEPWEIIKLLGLNDWNYFEKENKDLFNKIKRGEISLFCWRGLNPKDLPSILNRRSLQLLLSSISLHPQARSALKSRNVTALLGGNLLWRNIKPDEAEIDEAFGVREFTLPNKLGNYTFNKHFNSTLKITLSKNQLVGEKSSLNILEIGAFGKNIAYYDIPSLMMDKGVSKSLIAYIDCPELKEYNCVSNDRVYLIEGLEVTSLFKEWCKSKIKEVLEELADEEKKKEEREHLSALRNFLDIITEEISDLLEEDNLLKPTFSKLGKENAEVKIKTNKPGFGGGGKGGKNKDSERRGGEEIKEDKSENRKGKDKLKILISNKDEDPLNPGNTFPMSDDPRYDILHQRVEDIDYGIWWINSQKRYIKKMDIRDPSAYPFYFFLVKEIVLSHRLRKLQKEQSEIMPDDIERINFKLIDEIFNKIVGRLGLDLSTNKSNAEKLREAIQGKEKFTINQICEETGTDSLSVHAFIANPGNHILENYTLKKERNNEQSRKKNIINVYVRKN